MLGFPGEECTWGCNSLFVAPPGSLDGEGGWVPCLVCRPSLSPSVFGKLPPFSLPPSAVSLPQLCLNPESLWCNCLNSEPPPLAGRGREVTRLSRLQEGPWHLFAPFANFLQAPLFLVPSCFSPHSPWCLPFLSLLLFRGISHHLFSGFLPYSHSAEQMKQKPEPATARQSTLSLPEFC